MSWIEGTIEAFKGDNPSHRELRKIRISPGQDWNDLHFFHLSQARRAGYPDSALAAGQRIRFEPDDSDPKRPRVKGFAPYSPPKTVHATDTFLNPYHFIGLRAPAGILPNPDAFLANEPLHDRFASADPEAEGGPRYSGRVLCRLTTEGPVVVGSTQSRVDGDPNQETVVEPFRLGDPDAPGDEALKRPAVPGSTLRGLLSSLVEAASCSALRVLPDRPFTRRAGLGKESLSAVGRLEDQGGVLRLRPLTLSLAEMSELSRGTARPPKDRCRVFLKGYQKKDNRLEVRPGTFLARRRPVSHSADHEEYWYLDLDKASWHGSGSLPLGLIAGEDPIPADEWQGLDEGERSRYTRGVLLVLGLDGTKADNLPPGKRYEQFLPFPEPPAGEAAGARMLPIPKGTLDEFKTLLEDSFELPRGGEQNDMPYLHKGRRRGEGAPEPRHGDLVYFDTDPETGEVRHLSYSAVWRRGVRGGRLHDSVKLVSPELVPFNPERKGLTLAERLFGFVEAEGTKALAGRVRAAHALAEGEAPAGGWYEPAVTLKVLASPKPPSPALYFGNNGYQEKRNLNLAEHRPQGRKVYLHHRTEHVEAGGYRSSEADAKKKLKMRVTPLKTGTSFLFHLDFTNLTREELGLLLYAVRPTSRFRHKLGLGKPLGLGRVVIDPLVLAFHDRSRVYRAEGLFGPRYASFERLGDPVEWDRSPPYLARRYRDEREALERAAERAAPFPSAEELREEVREAMPGDVRWSLELLGDPDQVTAEVNYPVLRGQSSEGEHFRWFVENDRAQKQPMPAIRPGDPLPVLERYAESRRIKRSPFRGRRPR